MRTSRTLVVAAVAAALLCSLAPPAGAQAERQLTVTGSPVAPGGSFTVSGTGCIDGQPAVALLTADGEAPLATPVPPAADGAGNWSVAITVPSNTRPGRYPVQARCLGAYSGYDGYDGYDGYSLGGGFHYSTAHVDVLPPARLPASDGPLSVDPNVVVRGGTTRVTGDGWAAGEQVAVMLYSTPRILANVRTDAAGAIDVVVRIPMDASLGEHTVVAMNATSATTRPLTLSAPVTVVERRAPADPVEAVPVSVAGRTQRPGGGGSLPFTGGNPWPYVLLGVLLLAAGGELYRRSRATDGA